MRSYRCYFLNQTNRIAGVEIIEAEADEDALIGAARLLGGQPRYRAIEVWDGARRVFPRARDRVDVNEVKRALRGIGLRVLDDPARSPGERHPTSADTCHRDPRKPR